MLSPRQIHLDFHTSPYIPGVGASFDAEAFAATAKDAHVSSITVFARCHHGMLYYDSKQFPELVHPHLANKDLMTLQVRALHAVGIRAPIYITVQWDYAHATTRPDWLIRKRDGSHEGSPFDEPGFYQSLCVNTGYYDFLAAHTAEVCELLGDELDGLFFDIVGIRPCWCAACRDEMQQRGIDTTDESAVRAFAKSSLTRFKQKLTALVRTYSKRATIFYNAGHIGPCTKDSADAFTHYELESLASGSWGYLHFPVTARYARGLTCETGDHDAVIDTGYADNMGMTGKFHTTWGDFHSLKNLAALEFECFRMLSFGFACSIGDQLEPGGTLGAATYRLIGKVYEQFEQREPYARPSVPIVDAAVITDECPMFEHNMPEPLLGAAQMLEELAIQFNILDIEMDFSQYKLVVIPDGVKGSQAFADKLNAYVARGGKVIACGDGGVYDGRYPDCYGATYGFHNPLYPDFLIANGALAEGLEPGNEYVIYQQGVKASATTAQCIMQARAPYFARVGDHFCSHHYTPSAKGQAYPAVFQNGNVILFAHPLFAQYRHNAPNWCKTLICNAMDRLGVSRTVAHNGPSTLAVSVLDQPQHSRYTLHCLSYVPVRKSATIDVIEERTVVSDVTFTLSLPKAVKSATVVPDGTPLDVVGGTVTIGRIDGYAIVELTY